MSFIKLSSKAERQFNDIYTNYKLAYVGTSFSNSFLYLNSKIIKGFESLIPYATITSATLSFGIITYRSFNIRGVVVLLVESIIPSAHFFSNVERDSQSERRSRGVRRSSSIRASRINSYVFARDGGSLNNIPVEIVKRKVNNSGKPKFVENYRMTINGRPTILSRSDFSSCNAFVDNQARAWKCNGQQVLIDSSWLNESRIESNRLRLTESKLRKIIHEVIQRILIK